MAQGEVVAAPPITTPLATSVGSPGRRALRRFLRHRLAIIGLVVLVAIALFAIFATFFLQSP